MIKPFKEPIYVTRPLLPDLKEFNKELEEIWASKWLSNNGPKHQKLEEEIGRLLKVPYISLFNNGTIALIVAINSLRLSGEVITTPFTFPATPHVLAWNGIKPIFCDIDEQTMNIDVDKIEKMITPKTTAILGVHVFGVPCDVLGIQSIADRYGLKVIYDAAHAFDTEVDGTCIGNFGDISAFSFHATKLFHTAEGGALTFSDPNLKPRIDLLKNFGIKNEDEVLMPGINGKMNEIQAALGLVNLKYIGGETEKRKKIVETYNSYLNGIEGISIRKLSPNIRYSYQYYVIRIDREKFGLSRDEVYSRLKEYNIFSRKYFYPLCSDYVCYRQLPSANPHHLPMAKKIVDEVLCLPLYGGLSIDSAEKICEILKLFKK
ncbi:MAG: DegT/DnrJ/EryC1/StrS family aminotransferase [Dehalococcoidia bacterium]|jgi:dTDP-4-amino-4,6-dideoxygalactose transaminase